MFDDIDFLAPHSTAARPRRKPAPPPDVELVKPAAETPGRWERLRAHLRAPQAPAAPSASASASSGVAPIAAPPSPASHAASPAPASAAHGAHRMQGFWDRVRHPRPRADALPAETAPSVALPHAAAAPVAVSVPVAPKTPDAREAAPAPVPTSPASHPSLTQRMQTAFHHARDAASHRRDTAATSTGAILEGNLLPERERMRAGSRARVARAGVLGVAAVLAVLGAAAAFHWRTSLHERELQLIARDIADVERQMVQNASHLEDALAFQQRSRAVAGLLKTHTRWLSFLGFLEEITSPDVYYEGFTATREGAVSMRAHARDFHAAAAQLVAFTRDPRIRKASLSPLAAQDAHAGGPAEVMFEITMAVDPAVVAPPPPSQAVP